MQIKNIKISNVMSFPYIENLAQNPGTNFNIFENGSVNVLIGPNGAGKTNFLEIIQQVIKTGLLLDFSYNKDLIKSNPKEVVKREGASKHFLKTHIGATDKPSQVEITLHLNKNDHDNMLFIQRFLNEINNFIQTYSSITTKFINIPEKTLLNTKEIILNFDIDTKTQEITINKAKNTPVEDFIKDYLQNQELIQIFILLYNEFIKKPEEKALYPLKNTCTFVDGDRVFSEVEGNLINPAVRGEYIAKKNSPNTPSITGYYLCIRKIRNIMHHSSEENRDEKKTKIPSTPETIEKKLQHSRFYQSLVATVQKYLDQDLKIQYTDNKIGLYLMDKFGQKHELWNISHGEQSLLSIIFNLYGYDLGHGLMIIDEPEIHFHPQMQRRLIRMLEKMSTNIGTQFLVSTYSPIFINESNIANVYRFSKIKGNTEIKTPNNNILADESSLIQILKFENAAKIFFVDKIIMVEGEIDAYFFEYYLEYLHKFPKRKEKLTNYEIVNINGKGGYKKRNKFLLKFGIQTAFIGDWDNIVDYGFLTQSDLNHYYQQAKKLYTRSKRNKQSDRHYTKLVNVIKYEFPNKYKYILEKINELYTKNVFILKKGDIESYLGIHSKGIEETIDFCRNEFNNRLRNKEFETQRAELEEIIGKIFTTN